MLVDGGFSPDTLISEHVRLRDVMSSDRRYFRLDPSLLECLELAEEDFSGTIQVIFCGCITTISKSKDEEIFEPKRKNDPFRALDSQQRGSLIFVSTVPQR